MTVSLAPSGESTCTLIERTCASSVEFSVPLSKPTLITLITSILNAPDEREVKAAPVSVERMRDGLRVHVGSGSFFISYKDLFPLVLE